MPAEVEIERALATVTATLNDHKVETFERGKVQQIVDEALGGEPELTVDEGGGLHDQSGARVGAVRRTDSGEWIGDRQNHTVDGSDAAIPAKAPIRSKSKLRKLAGRA
jgi:hypothetical protein